MNGHTNAKKRQYFCDAEFDGEHWVDSEHCLLSLGFTTVFMRAMRGFVGASYVVVVEV